MEGKAASIVIIAGGSRPDIDELMLSLAETQYSPCETLVVDNSAGGLGNSFTVAFPNAKVTRPPARLTFAEGANFGMKAALGRGAQLVFLINDDVTVHPKALAILAEAERRNGPGIYAPEIWPYEGGLKRTRRAIDWAKRLAVQVPVTLNGSLTQIQYAEGSAMLISAEVVKRVGFFDEDFGFYYEDADYSIRAAAKGFPVCEAEGARVWHKGSVSAGKGMSPFKAYYRARNTVKFALKHRDRAKLVRIALYHFGEFVIPTIIRSTTRAIAGSRRDARVLAAVLKGTWDFIAGNGHVPGPQALADMSEEIDRLPLPRQAC